MSIEQARTWLIKATLILTGSILVFVTLAPAFGYPLEFSQGVRIGEIVLPVFLGYLGTASHFIFARASDPHVKHKNLPLLQLLVRGPIAIFAIVISCALFAFGFTNRDGASPGTGMTVDSLAAAVSTSLALLAVTTGVLVTYLFVAKRDDRTASDVLTEPKLK